MTCALDERIVVGSRWRYAGTFAIGLPLLAVCVLLIRTPDVFPGFAAAVGWLGLAFFVPCEAIILAQCFVPSRLVLSATHFRLERPLRKPYSVAWSDLQGFFVWAYHGTRLVAYRYRPDRTPGDAVTRVNRVLGTDGALPGGWPVEAGALAELLNRYVARAGRS